MHECIATGNKSHHRCIDATKTRGQIAGDAAANAPRGADRARPCPPELMGEPDARRGGTPAASRAGLRCGLRIVRVTCRPPAVRDVQMRSHPCRL